MIGVNPTSKGFSDVGSKKKNVVFHAKFRILFLEIQPEEKKVHLTKTSSI